MEFNQLEAIYLQIVNKVYKQILLEGLKEEQKLPSIRQLAIQMQVNPNTVVKSYAYMEQENIIYKKRGIGYFIQKNAKKNIKKRKKNIFLKNILPKVFEQMEELDISIDEIIKLYKSI